MKKRNSKADHTVHPATGLIVKKRKSKADHIVHHCDSPDREEQKVKGGPHSHHCDWPDRVEPNEKKGKPSHGDTQIVTVIGFVMVSFESERLVYCRLKISILDNRLVNDDEKTLYRKK